MKLGQFASNDDIFFSLAKPRECDQPTEIQKCLDNPATGKQGFDENECKCKCAEGFHDTNGHCCPDNPDPNSAWIQTGWNPDGSPIYGCNNSPIVAVGGNDLATINSDTHPLVEVKNVGFMSMSDIHAQAAYGWIFCIYQDLYEQYQYYFSVFLGGPFDSPQGCSDFVDNLPPGYIPSSSSSSSKDVFYCVVENTSSSGSEGIKPENCNYTTSDCQSMFGPDYKFYPVYTSVVNGKTYYCRCVAVYYGSGFMDFKEMAFVPGQQPLCVSVDEMRQNYQNYTVIEGPYGAGECDTNCGQPGGGGSGGGGGSSSSSSPSSSSSQTSDSGSGSSSSSSQSSESSSSSSVVYFCAVNKMGASSTSSVPSGVGGAGDCDSRCKAYFGPYWCGGDLFGDGSCECLPCLPVGFTSDIFASAFYPQPPFCISSVEINSQIHEVVGGPYANAMECNNSCGSSASSTPNASSSSSPTSPPTSSSSTPPTSSSSTHPTSSGSTPPTSSGSTPPTSSSSSSSEESSSSSSDGGSANGDGGSSGGGDGGSSGGGGGGSSGGGGGGSSGGGGGGPSGGDGSSSSESSSFSSESSSVSSESSSSSTPPTSSSSSEESSSSSSDGGSANGDGGSSGGGGDGSSSSESSSSSDGSIGFLSQPQDNTIVAGQAESNLFSVITFGPVTAYEWQQSVNGGATFSNINASGGVFTGVDTPTLGINAGMADTSSVFNGAKFRCVISSGGDIEYSAPATLTVVN